MMECLFFWLFMFNLSINPDTAKKRRTDSEDGDVCSMCGDFCAMKAYERMMKW